MVCACDFTWIPRGQQRKRSFLRRALILHLPNVLWIRRAFMLVLCYHVILFGVILRCKMEQTYKQTVM